MRNLIITILIASLSIILFFPLSIYLLLFKKWNLEEIIKFYKLLYLK